MEQAKPKQVRLGSVRAAIFENESKNGGDPFYTVRLSRSYKDKEGKTQFSDSFGAGELPAALKCGEEALRIILDAYGEEA